ncbi:MAG: DUF2975 domain-containing protein [Clostridiales bacterium]|jgi:hypothetical protein|nr:DUF2975 domain-containing protein [Clostridiales bacterium]
MKKLNNTMMGMLYFCLTMGVLFFCSLYWVLPMILFDKSATVADPRYCIELALWYAGAIGALYILALLIRMMKTLPADPFVEQNVICLRRMGYAALGMAGLAFIAAAVYYFRFMIIVLGMVLLFCALLSLILGNVFKKAVEYRDNDKLVI